MKEKEEQKEERTRERVEDNASREESARLQQETNQHNAYLIQMISAKLKVTSTGTPDTSVETFSFPFKSDEGSGVLTTPIGKLGQGIPAETNGVTALPTLPLTQSIAQETTSTNSSSQPTVLDNEPSNITPSKDDRGKSSHNNILEEPSSTTAGNEMESETTPDTKKRQEPSTPTKNKVQALARVTPRARKITKNG